MMGIALITANFFFFQFNYSSVFYNYDNGKMDTVSGFDAIEQRKEIAALFEGELTESTLSMIQQKIVAAETITAGRDENSVFSAVYAFYLFCLILRIACRYCKRRRRFVRSLCFILTVYSLPRKHTWALCSRSLWSSST